MSRVVCECGTELLKTSLKAHLLTEKHKKLLAAQIRKQTPAKLSEEQAKKILTSAMKSRTARQELSFLQQKKEANKQIKKIGNLSKEQILKIEEGAVKKIENAFKNRLLREKAKDKLEYLKYEKELKNERLKNPPKYNETEAKLILGRVFQSYSKKLEAKKELSELEMMSYEDKIKKDRKDGAIRKKFHVKTFDFDEYMKRKEYTPKEYKKVIDNLYRQLSSKDDINDNAINYLINQIYKIISNSDDDIIDEDDDDKETIILLNEIHRHYIYDIEHYSFSIGSGQGDFIVSDRNPFNLYKSYNKKEAIKIMKLIYNNIDKDENNVDKIYFEGYKQFKKLYKTIQSIDGEDIIVRDDLIMNIIDRFDEELS